MGFLSGADYQLMALFACLLGLVLSIMTTAIVQTTRRSTQRASGNVIAAGASITQSGASDLTVRANGIDDLTVTSLGHTNVVYEKHNALVLEHNHQRVLEWKRGETTPRFQATDVQISRRNNRFCVHWASGQNRMTLFSDANGGLK